MFGPPGHVQGLALGGVGGASGVIPRAIADVFDTLRIKHARAAAAATAGGAGGAGGEGGAGAVTVYCSFVQVCL